MRHSSPPFLHSENVDSDGIGIPGDVRKDGNHWARGSRTSSTMSFVVMDGLPLHSSSCTCCKLSASAIHHPLSHGVRPIDLIQLTMNFDRLCAFKKIITDRTSQSSGAGIRVSIFNRCHDAIVRTREVPLEHACANHATEGKRFSPPSTAVT